ncbi:tripartite motif-containing protein 59-like isoform X2 [Mizuhopecten yessoensis]|uniref:tripartite motif-containing protein 59-like isoform X2 n=1 Tax=Mizuhopecten yessoensis TaxID=6573 RepID=UPI000B459564|nr:tripartite motif-containing protein 59-like isoform X2 [Mizuhopecten yessoensis]
MACSKDQILTNQLDLEEDLTCSICLELYNDPVSLPCQHNFCRKCIHSHLHQKSDIHVHVLGAEHGRFPCPNCRDYVELTETDIKKLPKNFALQNIVHKFQSLKLENETKDTGLVETDCMYHNKPLMVYCDTCDEALCIECFPKRSHENHNVVHFKDKVKMYQEDVEQTILPQIIHLQESLKEMKRRLTGIRQETQELLQVNMEDVTESFQELRSAVNQKESELMSVFESKKEETDSRYKSHTDSLDEQLDTLENLNTKLSTISFQDPAKTIREIKSDKERCEKASRDESMTSENIKRLLGDVKELDVSKQIHGLNDDLKRIMSDINNMEIGTTGDTRAEAESTANFQLSRKEISAAAYSTTIDTRRQEERKWIKIVDPNTGKDISSEIYNTRRPAPLPYNEEEGTPFVRGLTMKGTPERPDQVDYPRESYLENDMQPQSGFLSLLIDKERQPPRRSRKQQRKEKKTTLSGFDMDLDYID